MEVDITKFIKKFCENIVGAFNKEYFILGIFSGGNPEVYTLTPAHMKRLQIWINRQITDYEKQFGEIDPGLPSPIQSPIQASDLTDTNEDGE